MGYATEGSPALIDKAFTELPVRRILETAGFHVASRRVMEKSGLRLGGEPADRQDRAAATSQASPAVSGSAW